MQTDTGKIMITAEETDILQEIMNIAFGRAASDLGEYIDIFVILSVPYVKLLKSSDLPPYMSSEIKEYDNISLVEQHFWGKFKGSAFLVFPADAGKKILSLLDGFEEYFESDPVNELVKEPFREVGNILIGACIGKIAETAGVSSLIPRRGLWWTRPGAVSFPEIFSMMTAWHCSENYLNSMKKNVNGYLFIVTSEESFGWLKRRCITSLISTISEILTRSVNLKLPNLCQVKIQNRIMSCLYLRQPCRSVGRLMRAGRIIRRESASFPSRSAITAGDMISTPAA